MGKLSRVGLIVALAATMATNAMAAVVPIDTTAAVAQIGEAQTAVSTVGGALIVMAAIVLGFRWVKANFF